MRSRVLWRRSATALGTYTATVLGFLATVVATRELGTDDYARFAAIVAATAFVQLLLDLTVEEALVKYGFRYVAAKHWGRLRRVFEAALVFKVGGGVLGGVALVALAPVAASLWGVDDVVVPMSIAAAIPIVQAPEGVAAGAIILRGRYDVRSAFLTLSMGLRLAGVAIGCLWGVTGAVVGMVLAQIVASAAISAVGLVAFRRFPQVPSERLAEDVPSLRRFVFSSTASSSLSAARTTLGTALIPAVAPIEQAAYFRNAQAPATGFTALSAPARMILLTEQTRDFEAGRHERVYAMLRRYFGGTTLAMLLLVPILWWLMPALLGLFYGEEFRLYATDAARLVLIAAALQLIWGWTKSFPVSIGRPGLRLVAQSVEIAVFVPLLLVLASRWGATGGAAAVVVSTVVFCALWTVLLVRLRNPRVARRHSRAERAGETIAVRVLVVSGIWPPDVGGPASHAPEVAAFLVERGHEVEAVITADAGARSRALSRALRGALASRRRSARAGRPPRRSPRPPRRRRLHDGDVRTLVARRTHRAAALRRQAHGGRGVRARASSRPLARHARRVPACARQRSRFRSGSPETQTSGTRHTS